MPSLALQIVVVFGLILANGLFSMVEIALVSVRKARFQQKAENGDKQAQRVLELTQNPGRLFSTVQVGITLIAILTGAIGGADISRALAVELAKIPFLAPYAATISFVLVMGVLTFFSIVLGELVPKRLAVNSTEKIALSFSGFMKFLMAVSKPAVSLLNGSTELVLHLMGVKLANEPAVTEEEFRVLLEEDTEAGVFEAAEQEMVESVLDLGSRRVSSLMTPRPDIVWLDVDEPLEETRQKVMNSGFSRFPVGRESLDQLLGEVQARDLLVRVLDNQPFDLMASITPALYVPEVMPVLDVLEQFKQASSQMALVIDEYGSLVGLITLTDILEMIVGDMPSTEPGEDPDIVQREDGSYLLDGMLAIEDLKELLHIDQLPGEEQGLFNTLAGFITSYLGRIPATADYFEWGNQRYEVVDMDANRIDRVLVSEVPPITEETTEEGAAS